jgi:uncharacterized membrane protein (UPF0127 family)
MVGEKKMATLMIAGIVLVVAAGIATYFFLFQKENPPLRNNTVKIGNAVFNVEIASSSMEKARGLSFRASLGEADGMLFLFSRPAVQNFWMKDMNFPLDMIWIGGNKVIGIAENVEPQPNAPLLKIYSSPDGTDSVLEVNAGETSKNKIKVGDTVLMGQPN